MNKKEPARTSGPGIAVPLNIPSGAPPEAPKDERPLLKFKVRTTWTVEVESELSAHSKEELEAEIKDWGTAIFAGDVVFTTDSRGEVEGTIHDDDADRLPHVTIETV